MIKFKPPVTYNPAPSPAPGAGHPEPKPPIKIVLNPEPGAAYPLIDYYTGRPLTNVMDFSVNVQAQETTTVMVHLCLPIKPGTLHGELPPAAQPTAPIYDPKKALIPNWSGFDKGWG